MASAGHYCVRPNEAPQPEPIAYLITWTTYGTWLSGDERGWVKRGQGSNYPTSKSSEGPNNC